MHKDDKNVDIGSHLYWRNVMQPLLCIITISFIKSSSFEVWGTLINILRSIALMMLRAPQFILRPKSQENNSDQKSFKQDQTRVCLKLIRMN